MKEQARLMTEGHTAAPLWTLKKVRSYRADLSLRKSPRALLGHRAQAAGGIASLYPLPFSTLDHRLSMGLPPPHTRGHVSISGDMSAVTARDCGAGTWHEETVQKKKLHKEKHRKRT